MDGIFTNELDAAGALAPAHLMAIEQGDGELKKVTLAELEIFSQRSRNVAFKSTPFLVASNKRKLTIKDGTRIKLPDDSIFSVGSDLELNVESMLDLGGSLTNGKDYYLFLYRTQGGQNVLIASLTKSAPNGLNPTDVIPLGGFHTLCVSAGSNMAYVMGDQALNHPLNDFIASDILPNSVWCLNHRTHSEPEGMVYIPTMDIWVDIYLQSGSGFNTKSAYQGAITRNRQYVDFVEDQICVNKALLNDEEFAAAMMGSNEKTSVNGANETGATTGGAGGRIDTAGRRMISIYGVEEGCGSLWQFLRTTSAGGYAGVLYGQTSAPGVSPVTYGVITTVQTGTGTNTQGTAHGPLPQSGEKGSFWGVACVLLAGGAWNIGSGCGSRSRLALYSRSRAISACGGRGRRRPRGFIV